MFTIRRTQSILGVALVALVATTAAVAGQQQPERKVPTADITGTWTAAFDTGIGPASYTYTFVLKRHVLTGKATGGFGESPLTEGEVDGANVFFVEMMDSAIRVEYSGTISSADEIVFSRKVGEFGVEDLVARREKK